MGPTCKERGKVAYRDHKEAQRVANVMTWKNKRAGRLPAKVDRYICPDCGMWHVGRGPMGGERDARVFTFKRR